ncbi:MAG: Fic family protein [Chitinophagales bacterium]|nr:Fic family protein [Chitinophagales bacterium]
MKKIEQAPIWYENKLFSEANNFSKSPEINEFVQKINDDYLYWDKVKYKKAPISINPEVLWSVVKMSRIFSKKINFANYSFEYNITNSIQKGLHEFDLNFGGNLSSDAIITENDKKRYLINSIMEEAIASSQIEGAVTTRKKAKEMLRKNKKPKSKSEQMILNNYNTIKHILEIKDKPITQQRILEIHKLITYNTLDNEMHEGTYRDSNEINVVDVIDGEIMYTPPSFEYIDNLMNDLFEFFNTNNSTNFIHPIIKGSIIHFMIGFIHPFVDGNGRTARALFYWYLLKNGYWLTEYLSISRLIVKSKTQYALAYLYTEIDDNDLTYFINYKIKTLQLAFDELKNYINRKIKEKKKLADFQKIENINERQAYILKWLYDNSNLILTVNEIQNRFSISNQTARTDLTELVKLGFLVEKNANKKSKVFFKVDNFEQLIQQQKI